MKKNGRFVSLSNCSFVLFVKLRYNYSVSGFYESMHVFEIASTWHNTLCRWWEWLSIHDLQKTAVTTLLWNVQKGHTVHAKWTVFLWYRSQ